MSRLTIVPVLATLGFLPACAAEVDDGDLGDYEGLQQEVPDSDSEEAEDVLATRAVVDPEGDFDPDVDLGDFQADADVDEAAGPMLHAPRLLCGSESCFEGGEAARPLRGRDVIRNSYFMIAGYPDLATYYSHTGHESGPPQVGLWGATIAQIHRMNATLIEAGLTDCEALPETTSRTVDSGHIRLDAVEIRVPERLPNGLKILDREVSITSRESGLHGVATFACATDTARYGIDFKYGGEDAHVDAWVGSTEDGTELELVGHIGRHRFATALGVTEDGASGVVVSVHSTGSSEFGWRTVMESDGNFASGYIQFLKGSPRLTLAPDAYAVRIDGKQTGASRDCHRMSHPKPFKSGDCDGLALEAPLNSVFDTGVGYSLGWVSRQGPSTKPFGF